MPNAGPHLPTRDEIRRAMGAGEDRPRNAPSANEHFEIVDALYRFGAGQDLRDRGLFESAFAADAILDFTGPARRLGVEIAAFEGRQAIADAVFASIAGLDTTHTVTNPRVTSYDGARATLSALVEAQHLPRKDHARHLLLKNLYTVVLSKHGPRWVIERLRIDNIWWNGDPAVLFPTAAQTAPEEIPHA
ncbi:nuclear transport factor 2 family protein [Luteimonas gilva]|nr:nuclear transport factor 2 family protein [Luteimonas gilva]